MRASLLGCFDPKGGVAMLAEIFMVRLEAGSTACGRSPAVEHVPLDTVQREWPIWPSSNRTSRAKKLQVKSGLSEWSGNRSGSSLSW